MKGYLEALHHLRRYVLELGWLAAVYLFAAIIKLAIWRKKLCRYLERKKP